MAARIRLDPERIAQLEAGGWRAYYVRNWPKLLGLMVQLNQEQFLFGLFAPESLHTS